MSDTIATNDGTQIYYKNWGAGQPVVFSRGWPLRGRLRQPDALPRLTATGRSRTIAVAHNGESVSALFHAIDGDGSPS